MNDEPDSPRWRPTDEPILRVYVAEHCGTCHEARRLAKVVSGRLKAVAVEVVDIDRQEPVDEIFAVPTFCYRGKILSLGNPREDELIARVLTMDRESVRSARPCTEDQGSGSPFLGIVPQPEIDTVVYQRETIGKRKMLIVAWSGALGLVGTLLCSLTMVAPALGLIALEGTRSSMGGMSSSDSAGQSRLLVWWTNSVHLGPKVLVLSVFLLVLAVAARRRLATVPAIAGGLFLYVGMYVQTSVMAMEAVTVIGTGLLVLAYAASLRPSLGLATARSNR